MIGVPTSDMARQAIFYDYLGILIKPEGTIESKCHGQSPARNRNMIIDQAIEHNCTHIFFIDDDVLLPPDALLKLLESDVDMVTGLYLMRTYPHSPILFAEHSPEGFRWAQLSPGCTGLVKVESGGLGCCLIKTSVFYKLEKPYIRLGELKSEQDHWCDDVGFFNRTRKIGIQLYCDLDVQCGHIASTILRPVYQDGVWYTAYDTQGSGMTLTPQLFVPTPEVMVK